MSTPNLTDELLQLKRDECEKVNKFLSTDLYHLHFKSVMLDQTPLSVLISDISSLVDHIKPEVVYTHFFGDSNQDHRIISTCVNVIARKQSICEVYMGEVPDSTPYGLIPFKPNVFIDISQFIDTKLEAVEMYWTELKTDFHPRSVKNVKLLASYRGIQCGTKFAEAFMQTKRIIKD